MKSKPVLGFANQKGGVGKTTWSKIFSEYLAIVQGKDTLGIDIDSQTSFTARFFGINKNPITDYKEPPLHPYFDPNNADGWDGKSSIADIFFGKIPKPYPTKIERLDLIPSDEGNLFKAENVKRQEMADKVYGQLYNFINLQDVQKSYDIFVIDTPPAKGPLTISAFKAMTHLVIPLEIELQAIEGLTGLLQLWKQEAMSRPTDFPLHLVGILPNKVHSRRATDKDLLQELRSDPGYGNYIMPVQMVDRTEIPLCDLEQKTIFQYPDSNPAKQEAMEVCNYIYGRIFQ
ncbi:MAG TPA: ParA family protein [Candidatus Babeliales bacterium]|nr:ParA family protein [Candidatus Babeliales bacterium]